MLEKDIYDLYVNHNNLLKTFASSIINDNTIESENDVIHSFIIEIYRRGEPFVNKFLKNKYGNWHIGNIKKSMYQNYFVTHKQTTIENHALRSSFDYRKYRKKYNLSSKRIDLKLFIERSNLDKDEKKFMFNWFFNPLKINASNNEVKKRFTYLKNKLVKNEFNSC